jgi:four helix bundle protein
MKKEIEKRLVRFSVSAFQLTGNIGKTEYSAILSNQLLRSSTSAALNYGEAQGAETTRDFIHKIGVVMKELRESRINLYIIQESGICRCSEKIDVMLKENDELIAIFYTTLKNARLRLNSKST